MLNQIVELGGVYRRRDGSITGALVSDEVLKDPIYVADVQKIGSRVVSLAHIVGTELPSYVFGPGVKEDADLIERIR